MAAIGTWPLSTIILFKLKYKYKYHIKQRQWISALWVLHIGGQKWQESQFQFFEWENVDLNFFSGKCINPNKKFVVKWGNKGGADNYLKNLTPFGVPRRTISERNNDNLEKIHKIVLTLTRCGTLVVKWGWKVNLGVLTIIKNFQPFGVFL